MAQTGDPEGTGMGRSSLPNLKAEFTQTPYRVGSVGMARGPSPDSPIRSSSFAMRAAAG